VVVDGRAANDVASDLGISVNAVYLARGRVLRRLREGLEGLMESRSGKAGLSFSAFVIEASFQKAAFPRLKAPTAQVPYDVAVETGAVSSSIPPAGSHMRLTQTFKG